MCVTSGLSDHRSHPSNRLSRPGRGVRGGPGSEGMRSCPCPRCWGGCAGPRSLERTSWLRLMPFPSPPVSPPSLGPRKHEVTFRRIDNSGGPFEAPCRSVHRLAAQGLQAVARSRRARLDSTALVVRYMLLPQRHAVDVTQPFLRTLGGNRGSGHASGFAP